MKATVLQIEDKVKKSDLDLARLSDFRYRVETTVDARTILSRPEITLYCLDDERRQAVFVEALPGVDVSEKPYYFLTQYQNAQRLMTTPYDVLHELAATIGDRFQRLIPMYSVSRCGGTLVSRAMNRLDNVLSLDEPDIYNNIVLMRPGDGSRDAELTKLLHSCTRLLFRPVKPEVDTLFMKFRWVSIEIGDLMFKAFPAAKGMFLYRNAETWARSVGRSIEALLESHESNPGEVDPWMDLFRLLNLSKTPGSSPNTLEPKPSKRRGRPAESLEFAKRAIPLLPPYIRRTVRDQLTGRDKLKVLALMLAQRFPVVRGLCRTPAEIVEPYIQAIPPMKLLILLWLSTMQKYLAMHEQGIPMLAVRYETLVEAPEAALEAIFEYCGIPAGRASVAKAAFAEDSQQGTPLARARVSRAKLDTLGPELLAQLREVLREYPPIQTPDFVVPSSLDLRRSRQSSNGVSLS